MTPPILLTGGTGTLGRIVVPGLREAGCTVRLLSRRGHESRDGIEYVTGDLATREGSTPQWTGPRPSCTSRAAPRGDEDKARNVVRAASGVGVKHLVYISVVGADRIPVVSGIDRAMFGYFAAKRAAELIVSDSGLPWTILRATQFHDFVLALVQPMARLPVVPTFAGVRFQPVDARDVATRLVELSLGEPSGLVPDIGGPRVYEMKELVRSYLKATHRHRLIMPVRTPGKAARAYRTGANLAPERAVGQRTWEDFLTERLR
ncbi:MAG: SDR family oxidoreductase [Jiangellaceae bacterium]